MDGERKCTVTPLGAYLLDKRGRVSALAKALGVSRNIVVNWAYGRTYVPWKYVLPIVELSDGALRIEDIAPEMLTVLREYKHIIDLEAS